MPIMPAKYTLHIRQNERRDQLFKEFAKIRQLYEGLVLDLNIDIENLTKTPGEFPDEDKDFTIKGITAKHIADYEVVKLCFEKNKKSILSLCVITQAHIKSAEKTIDAVKADMIQQMRQRQAEDLSRSIQQISNCIKAIKNCVNAVRTTLQSELKDSAKEVAEAMTTPLSHDEQKLAARLAQRLKHPTLPPSSKKTK